MLRPARTLVLVGLVSLLALSLSGCSDSTAPGGGNGNLARIGAEGDLDPTDGTFVLKTLQMPPPWDGPPISIELVGSNLVVDEANEQISLDVAIRSRHPYPLYAPAVVWVEGFTPPGVSLINADYGLVPPTAAKLDTFTHFVRFGFDYSGLMGDDGLLEFEETSATKTWIFHDPGLGSFSFQGWAEFGMEPDLPRIAGRCFIDQNNNGWPEPDEPPLAPAFIAVSLPNGDVVHLATDPEGHWAMPVEDAGLYRVHCNLAWMMPMEPCFTTPNPLDVLWTPGPDGLPNGFEDANFGLCTFEPSLYPPILFTDEPPDSLHFGYWTLIGAEIEGGHYLRMHVGFSGCQPDQPFTLYASGGFMESEPPQINVVLVHEIEEGCDAWFEDEFVFDLMPLWHRYMDAYGPGMLMMNLVGTGPEIQHLVFPIFPEDKPRD